MASPLDQQCTVCHARASETVTLAVCSRCQLTFYCSRDHQTQDYATHKTPCRQVNIVREQLNATAAQLRVGGQGAFCDPDGRDLFELFAGRFGVEYVTRSYMQIKRKYVEHLTTLGTRASLALALQEALDSLRLGPTDMYKVRDGLPTILLLLGNVQACYGLLKWWVSSNAVENYRHTFNWTGKDVAWLTENGAAMAEPITCFQTCRSEFVLVAVVYIKMKLALQVQDVVHARMVSDRLSLPAPVQSTLDRMLVYAHCTDGDLRGMRSLLVEQAAAAFQLSYAKNRQVWAFAANFEAANRDRMRSTMRRNVAPLPWMAPLARLWRGHRAFVDKLMGKSN